jgi:hypothetical protein
MAPHWTSSVRPMVLVFTAIAVLITVSFRADVDAQAGAYSTGVLVLITSAAFAVMLSARRDGRHPAVAGYGAVTAVLAYTTAANVVERPEGIKIASLFIAGVLLVSLTSRAVRAFELRVTSVHLDPTAARFVAEQSPGPVRMLAHECSDDDLSEYRRKLDWARRVHNLPDPGTVVFVEVAVSDPSEFECVLEVAGLRCHGFRILRLVGPSVPNAIAALLVHIRGDTGVNPHVYFEWSEGNPLHNLLRYLVLGSGEVALVTREILRETVPDPRRRPTVHVA